MHLTQKQWSLLHFQSFLWESVVAMSSKNLMYYHKNLQTIWKIWIFLSQIFHKISPNLQICSFIPQWDVAGICTVRWRIQWHHFSSAGTSLNHLQTSCWLVWINRWSIDDRLYNINQLFFPPKIYVSRKAYIPVYWSILSYKIMNSFRSIDDWLWNPDWFPFLKNRLT